MSHQNYPKIKNNVHDLAGKFHAITARSTWVSDILYPAFSFSKYQKSVTKNDTNMWNVNFNITTSYVGFRGFF